MTSGAVASAALADAAPEVLWLDTPDRPAVDPTMCGGRTVDLLVVGAGYTGLWAAIQAKEDDPSSTVAVIDAGRVAEQASGRNGGFCSSSLTHGLENGQARFPREMARIERIAADNFAGIAATIDRHGIDCHWEPNGALTVATAPWLVDGLHETIELAERYGHDVELLDEAAVREHLASPTYVAGVWQRSGEATVDPARLAWGLADAARSLGVDIYERTEMLGLDREGAGMAVRTASGTVRCAKVVLATNAFRSPLGAINRRIAPVYDYVLATEPLSDAQLADIGWSRRQGVSDTTNQFHYYRLTHDRRIVWGGYDALYHYGSRIDPSLDQRDETHALLAQHFFETFPQLDGLRFTHRWGGVIDTCTRFSVTFGTAHEGRVAYAVGYTGLGVGATRFGARVCLDLLYHPDSELLSLDLVRRRAVPFPPEPVRWAGIELTRRALANADERQGRRGPWLRLLDSLGLGFDS
ncbi:MAG: FAD-dependent oxidoreductase [Acidimicrobiales bacterium]